MLWNSLRRLPACLLWLLSVISLPANTAEAPAVYRPCIACHGADGLGNMALSAPALAGQDVDYLKRQLRQFVSGQRGTVPSDTLGAQMRSMVVNLQENDIEALADYLAALPVRIVPASSEEASANLHNGNNQYQARCGACHGGNGQGNPALFAPNLAILDSQYIKRQLAAYRHAERGYAEDDRFGRQMRMMANTLTNTDDIRDVIAHIRSRQTVDSK